MKLTDKQRKGLWIAGIVLVLIHFAPHIIATAMQALHPAPAVIPKPAAAHPASVQPQAVVVPTVSPEDAQTARLAGLWLGQAIRPEQAMSCILRLELKTDVARPNDFTGYSTMSCGPTLAFMGGRVSQSGEARKIVTELQPVSAILSGSAVNGSIELHVDEIIGMPHDACTLTSFTLTPFGDNNLSARWQEDGQTCHGGNMIMQRSAR